MSTKLRRTDKSSSQRRMMRRLAVT